MERNKPEKERKKKKKLYCNRVDRACKPSKAWLVFYEVPEQFAHGEDRIRRVISTGYSPL